MFASNSAQNETGARLSISFSAKGSIVSLPKRSLSLVALKYTGFTSQLLDSSTAPVEQTLRQSVTHAHWILSSPRKTTVTHNCHSYSKLLTAQTKIFTSMTNNSQHKPRYSQRKSWNSQQKQMAHSTNQNVHSKRKTRSLDFGTPGSLEPLRNPAKCKWCDKHTEVLVLSSEFQMGKGKRDRIAAWPLCKLSLNFFGSYR